jgi:hypothetical protein
MIGAQDGLRLASELPRRRCERLGVPIGVAQLGQCSHSRFNQVVDAIFQRKGLHVGSNDAAFGD